MLFFFFQIYHQLLLLRSAMKSHRKIMGNRYIEIFQSTQQELCKSFLSFPQGNGVPFFPHWRRQEFSPIAFRRGICKQYFWGCRAMDWTNNLYIALCLMFRPTLYSILRPISFVSIIQPFELQSKPPRGGYSITPAFPITFFIKFLLFYFFRYENG